MTQSNIFAIAAAICIATSTTAAQAQDAAPAPDATPSPAPKKHEYYLSGDYLFSTTSTSEFSPYGTGSRPGFAGRIGADFDVKHFAVMGEATYDRFSYDSTTVPSFDARNTDWDARVGVGLQKPKLFLVASYAQRSNNYGFPNLQGYGFGVEKLADYSRPLSVFGSYLWYPHFAAGNALAYGFWKYQAGMSFNFRSTVVPVSLEVGYMGDYGYNKLNAPSNVTSDGVFAGIGVHL
jgi:hypothetical protein